jgi:hypothetical protein
MTLVQTLITAAVMFLVGYQGSITGTSRLRKESGRPRSCSPTTHAGQCSSPISTS